MRTTRRVLLIGIVTAFVAVACSSSDSTETSSTSDAPAVTGDDAGDATTTTTGSDEPYVSDVYQDEDKWLCRPDMASNPCVQDLDLTIVEEDGTTEVVAFTPATDPIFDCFWVYPTINLGSEGNAPFDGDYSAELGVTEVMAARFSSVCDVYAPVYRQVTLGAFGSDEVETNGDIAYADVADAFRQYLANDNDGRPFMVFGHSQGSSMLLRLLTDEIDPDPELRAQMSSAMLIGASVGVPEGEAIGADLQNIAVCTTSTETGCVVTYASFRSTAPPPENSFFGGTPRSGEGVSACTNPAAIAGGPADLTSIFPTVNDPFEPGAAGAVAIDTPYWQASGLLTGECVSTDGFNYLEITVNGDPSGPRIDDITGDLTPEWGLHAVDYNLALADLIALAELQAAEWYGGE